MRMIERTTVAGLVALLLPMLVGLPASAQLPQGFTPIDGQPVVAALDTALDGTVFAMGEFAAMSAPPGSTEFRDFPLPTEFINRSIISTYRPLPIDSATVVFYTPGCYFTDDRGENWTFIDRQGSTGAYRDDANKLWGIIFDGISSVDSGLTWQTIENLEFPLFFVGRNDHLWSRGTSELNYSDDRGESWTRTQDKRREAREGAVSDAGRLVGYDKFDLETKESFFFSIAPGEDTAYEGQLPCFAPVAFSPPFATALNGKCYVALPCGLFELSEDGTTWTRTTHVPDGAVPEALLFTSDGLAYLGTDQGLFIGSDVLSVEGETGWERVELWIE